METERVEIKRLTPFIGGRYLEGTSGDGLTVINPATGAEIAVVAAAGPREVAEAVEAAAQAARGSWGLMPKRERAAHLRRIGELLVRSSTRLATIECLDTGHPFKEILDLDVSGAAGWFNYFADVLGTLRSDVIEGVPGYFSFAVREPHGVVGIIIPWNFPLFLLARKSAAALAMGNAVVIKPAEETPLSTLEFGEICLEAGLPSGVVNIIPGEGETTGRELVGHPGVDLVTFTGSVEVGREVASRAGQNLTPVVLELGGKSPNIVFADADLEAACASSLFTFCSNQGQVCSAGTRLLAEASICDRFVADLVNRAQRVRVGDPFDEKTQVGAVISERQMERIERYVALGQQEGAKLLTGGDRYIPPTAPGGLFYRPTVFRDVDPKATIAQEEIFGPVLSVIPFHDEAEALAMANDVPYGLAAFVWTRDLSRAHRMIEGLQAGSVVVNSTNVGRPSIPIGGYKDSGFGVEGGIEHALSMTKLKAVQINIRGDIPIL